MAQAAGMTGLEWGLLLLGLIAAALAFMDAEHWEREREKAEADFGWKGDGDE